MDAFRFPGNARKTLVQNIRQIVRQQGKQLLGTFVVVQPGHVCISKPARDNQEGV